MRNESIDIAKCIGIFFIVLGHTLRSGYLEYYIFSFHVPLFFMASGLCWKNPTGFVPFLKKRIKSLLIPYYVFSIISVIVYMGFGKIASERLTADGTNLSFIKSIGGMLYANSKTGNMEWNTPLWFLPCLFACNILVYLLEKRIANQDLYRFISILGLFCLNKIASDFFANIYLPFHIETAIGMTGFFELGIWLRRYYIYISSELENVSVIKCGALFLLLQSIGIWCIIGNNNVRVDVRIDHYGNYLLYVLGAVSLSMAVFLLSNKLHSRKMQYVGQHTLGILLMHKFPVVFFQTMIPAGQIVLTQPNTIRGIVLACTFASISMIMCLVVDSFINRFMPFLYGK